jgi:hypothetical protein
LVMKGPGEMQLTRMPNMPSSIAIWRTKWSTPA